MTTPSPGFVVLSTWDFGLKSVEHAASLLTEGAYGLDVVEKTIRIAEDDPAITSVGYGGYPNREGAVELDAAIIDGPRHYMGAVSGLRGIRHPISVARLVLEQTPHVLLTDHGALEFALQNGFKQENLLTEAAHQRWSKWKRTQTHGVPETDKPWYLGHDTICLLLLDSKSNIYGGASTSGLAWKMSGRVGDTPLIGSGLFADNDVGAAAATGVGELAISQCASFAVVELLRSGYDPQEACEIVLHRVLKKTRFRAPRQLALIALRKDGKIGHACLLPGFAAPVYRGGKSELIEVEPLTDHMNKL